MAAGEAHALLLTVAPEPRVYSIGRNEYGQLGLGDTMMRPDTGRAWEITGLSHKLLISGVACGGNISMALSQRGDVWTWGKNEESGVLGHGALAPVASVPAPGAVVNLRHKVRAVQAATTGWTALCVSHLGAMYTWGGGLCGVHGHGHQEDEPSAKAIRGLEGVPIAQVAAGALHVLALSNHGEVLTWGRICGAFGVEAQLQLVPKTIEALMHARIVQVAAGGEHSLALAEGGEVYGWGVHATGALGAPPIQHPKQQHAIVHRAELGGLGRVLQVGCGRCHSLFLAAAEGNESRGDGGRERSGDLWLCGTGVSPGEHVASQIEGMSVARAGMPGPGEKLSRSTGLPLQLLRVDVRKVLEMLG